MKPDRMLIVCRGTQEAHYQQKLIDPKEDRFMFTWPGSAMHGHRFHTILISGAILEDIRNTMPLPTRELRYERYVQWREQIRCRLARDGVLIEI